MGHARALRVASLFKRIRRWLRHRRKVNYAVRKILNLPAPDGVRRTLRAVTTPDGNTTLEVEVSDKVTGRFIRQDCTVVLSPQAMSALQGIH